MLTVNKKFTIVRLLCAFAIAIALSVAVIFAVSEEPVTAIYNLFLGPLQSKRHFFEVFASSVPLIFTGLALGLVFKSGNFSMIADACLYTGAVVTAALAIKTSLPFAVHPIVIMIAAAAVGGLIGSIPALLKVYFHTNELVTSLMFNYVFFYLGIYNVTKFLADREAGTFASKKYQATASLGKLISGTNFHVGYLIAIAAVILLYILVYKTKFGYEVRISGSNPEFAKLLRNPYQPCHHHDPGHCGCRCRPWRRCGADGHVPALQLAGFPVLCVGWCYHCDPVRQ